MNIVCLTPWFPRYRGDKTGNFVLDSVEALAELGHNVSVLITRPLGLASGAYETSNDARIDIGDVAPIGVVSTTVLFHPYLPRNVLRPLSNWFYHRTVAAHLAALAQGSGADVIHAHTEIPGTTAVRVATELGLPSVVTIHGTNTNRILSGTSQRAFYRTHLSRASRVVLVGEPLRDYVASVVGRADHFRVVHNGFRPPQNDVGQAKWDLSLRLISVSNLHEGKGIDLTLAALRRLQDSGVTGWTYNIVGGGDQSAMLKQLVRDLGLSEKVVFAGHCTQDEVYRHLAQANVFVLPSFMEAFGIAYLEAMALGLLTIGVRGQGPSGFIRDGQNGLLVEPQDVDSLFACLRSVNDDMPRMNQIASCGREYVYRNMTWRKHAESLSSVFAEIV